MRAWDEADLLGYGRARYKKKGDSWRRRGILFREANLERFFGDRGEKRKLTRV